MKALILKALMPLVRIYWKLFRPKTFGVKAVVVLEREIGNILLVRHTYGDKSLWNLPGGKYNPRKETPETAIQRELREELGCEALSLRELGKYYTEGEGKRDTVQIFLAVINCIGTDRDAEIAEMTWCPIDSVGSMENVARVARTGARQYEETF